MTTTGKGKDTKVTGPATKQEAEAAVESHGKGVSGLAAAIAGDLGTGVTTAQVEASINRVLAQEDDGAAD